MSAEIFGINLPCFAFLGVAFEFGRGEGSRGRSKGDRERARGLEVRAVPDTKGKKPTSDA
jgi:hypothetical protein